MPYGSGMLSKIREEKYKLLIYVTCSIFSFCTIAGYLLVNNNCVARTLKGTILLLVFTVLGGMILSKTLLFFFRHIKKNTVVAGKKFEWKEFIIWWTLIFVCYIPVWLAFYPGIAAYDANIQVMQFMQNEITTHHPVLHTLFLGSLYKAGTVAEKPNMGIDWYAIIQMLIMSAIFAYVLAYLRTRGIERWKQYLCFIFFAIFPVNSMMAISTTKDSLFAVLVLLFMVQLQELLSDEQYEWKKIGAYVFTSVLMLMLRNNAIYAWLLSIPIMACMKMIKQKKKFCLLHLLILLCFFMVNRGIMFRSGAEKGSPIELLSVPAQQMGRVGFYYGDEIEDCVLTEYIPRETLEQYDPYLADPIKFQMNAEKVRGDKRGFIKEWIRLGFRYPGTYLNAFLCNSIGFWYLGDVSHANIYGDSVADAGYLMDLRLSYNDKTIGTEKIILPCVHDAYHQWFVENGYQKWFLVQILFAPAFWWWIGVTAVLFFVYRKQYCKVLPCFFLGAYYISLLFGPACMVRYIYPIMVCVPVLWCLAGKDSRKG